MQLRYISIPALIAEAGGDPWAVDRSLQAGSPFRISQLAEAFHAAGRCTAEANHSFEQARDRFDAAWNHQDGDHPINDSAEVQRVTKSLGGAISSVAQDRCGPGKHRREPGRGAKNRGGADRSVGKSAAATGWLHRPSGRDGKRSQTHCRRSTCA
ncbi:hypothetical protein MAP_1064 [Mycobacterium avium subsp. paratuberculosis K-10]|uniref:Predicted hydrolase N-terminal domain-containing protein n=1 Tax=Mycolicibacterium paratuberculosis (strain ATCC BAA-968 / K-10) TaxID=262316 RepID=Q741M6_MYCPA|nr:hypothetical protein MAP_1064 [Mycobacterium avium subsp. paratuberculosis K-10]AGL37672.1 hypothetical protein MAP4_2792 [Mycobacterium avium subsp. paratuberculosis MAP4]